MSLIFWYSLCGAFFFGSLKWNALCIRFFALLSYYLFGTRLYAFAALCTFFVVNAGEVVNYCNCTEFALFLTDFASDTSHRADVFYLGAFVSIHTRYINSVFNRYELD